MSPIVEIWVLYCIRCNESCGCNRISKCIRWTCILFLFVSLFIWSNNSYTVGISVTRTFYNAIKRNAFIVLVSTIKLFLNTRFKSKLCMHYLLNIPQLLWPTFYKTKHFHRPLILNCSCLSNWLGHVFLDNNFAGFL